ncbi:hypothetical protein H6P81_014861 [Aristolochia fimbriata]|uniref:FAS1 domain-containing protein n=1 Tax=Aristolochia fimbriata TaxID=158543 RepID=A0AAV7E6R7_ARIFI|nr:hypothetical protein H6P81_014861 [Aristolochia fimbriata]
MTLHLLHELPNLSTDLQNYVASEKKVPSLSPCQRGKRTNCIEAQNNKAPKYSSFRHNFILAEMWNSVSDMGLSVLLLLALFQLAQSQSISAPAGINEMESAMEDLRSRSYDGFVILLKMINHTSTGVTFLVPMDKVLSQHAISPLNLRQFVLHHRIGKPLPFKNLMNFPTGTQIPSGLPNQMFTIVNGGRRNFSVNNAKIIAPNMCRSPLIKCHGIDAVISFDHQAIPPPSALAPSPALLPLLNLSKNVSDDIHRQEPWSSSTDMEEASAGNDATQDTLLDQKSSSGVHGMAVSTNNHLAILLSGLSLLLFTVNI